MQQHLCSRKISSDSHTNTLSAHQDDGGINGLRTTRRGTVAGAAIEKEDGAGNKVEAGIIEKGSAGTVAGAMETGTSRAGTETGRSAQHIAVLAKPGRTP